MFRTALIFFLLAVPARDALAWGPFTHATISRWALDRIREEGPVRLQFLTQEPARSIFVAASMGPDMTFSVTGLGKTDRELDSLLHAPEVCKRLLQEALAEGSAEKVAFALGWNAHLVADTVMCRPGSVIYRNVFELDSVAIDRLGGDVPGLLKIVIDSLLSRTDPTLLRTTPRFDLPLLETALQVGSSEKPPIATRGLSRRLHVHAESFTSATASLREICRSLAANTKALPALAAALTEPDGLTIPGLDDSATAIAQAVEKAMPAGFRVDAHPGKRVAAPKPALGTWDRLTAGVTRHGRTLLAGDGFTSRLSRGVLDGLMQAMNAMGVARNRTRRARMKATFLGEMISGEHDWPAVSAAVRAVAQEAASEPAPEDSPDTAPLDAPP